MRAHGVSVSLVFTIMVWLAGVQGLDAATTRYVWRNNPNTPVPPYDGGWQSAATNIQDALDVALDGDTVLVTNGVYNTGGRVAPGDTTLKTRASVTNAVTLVSVNGPEVTVIAGQPVSGGGLGDTAVRGVYLPTNSVLSGFTVTNGFTRSSTSATTPSYIGGGIRCEGVGSLVTNCVVVGNSAAMRGGGIYQGTVIGCDIITNVVVVSHANAGGGGVHSASVHQSLLERNVTLGSNTDGGGAHTCVMSQCILRNNVSGRHGGGSYSGSLVSCTVESNRAVQQGGGGSSVIVVTNSVIRWNTAGQHGGGLYKGAVTDSVIASNTVTGTSYDGGGYWGDTAANDRLVGCLIVGNSAINGGGVYNAVLSNCVVQANRALGTTAATGNGGGYYVNGTAYSAFNTRFLDNEANYQGGGAYQGKFFNCIFSGNRAARGGGAFLGTGYQLNSCSVMGNIATNLYGGTYNGTISNSIVMANAAVTSPNYSAGTFRHSCADPLPTGAGNTNVNPLVTGYRDPHLLPGSPLINMGGVSAWMASAKDLDGDARVSAGLVDIGADQFTGSTLEGALAVTIVASTNVWALNWPNTLRAEASGKVKGIAWAFGDGATAGNVNPVNHAFAAPGPYTVTVTVSNETHTATATYAITVVDYIVYASPTGGHVAPFASWADAATNLQAAVDAVSMPGGRVLATNGVYDVGARVAGGQSTTNRLVLDKAVRVESVNGPEATAIVGRWHSEATPLGVSAIRGVYVGGSAILCGFTVSNSATPALTTGNNAWGGGIFLAAGGVATNCVIANCRAWRGGGAASQAGAAGELRGCVVSNNQAVVVSANAGQGGGVTGLNATGCQIATNTAYQGGGAYACTLERCDLLENTASYQGGGAYACTLEACELLRNTAGFQGGGAFNGTLNRCRVRENSAVDTSSGAGGGVFDATLFSCLIAGNTARQGGGVYGSTAAKGMFNCTVVNNTAWVTGTTEGGGGFYGDSAYPVRNCIIYYNTTGGLSPNLYQGAVSYTCSLPLPVGTGNREEAPMLADFSSARLLSGSPCVGVGLYEPWMAGALDLEGEARSEGGSVDMGADQLFSTGGDGPLTVEISSPGGFYYPNVTYEFQALIDGQPSFVHWDFGDGQELANATQASHAWPEGQFTVTLTASNATHSAQATLELNVAPDTRYVSPAGSHTPPFRSWETAATNLQDAADAVMVGGRIRVAAGVYSTGGRAAGGSETLLNRLFVTNGVAVIAMSGPTSTFIVGAASGAAVTNGLGDGAVRGVQLLSGASLNGFTVTGGRTRWTTTNIEGDYAGGGISCADSTCVVSNCIVTACAAAARGGGIYRGTVLGTTVEGNGVYSSGSELGLGGGVSHATVISNCVIRANESRSSGGGVYQGLLVASRVEGNRITLSGSGAGYCGGDISQVVRGCTVINNSGASYGGGIYYATVYDTLLTNNAAVNGGGYAMPLATTPVCLLYRCRLYGNRASSLGGGSFCGTLHSCVLAGNRAGASGGGAYYCTLEASSVLNNTAVSSGGGIKGGSAYFSLIYYNTSLGKVGNWSSTTLTGCCTTPDAGMGYEITAAPQVTGFKDPHLLEGSPCLNAGDSRQWMSGAEGLDLDGETRHVFSDYDIGADERHAAGLEGPLAVSVSVDQTTVGLGYAPVFWAEATGRIGEMRWAFGDGGTTTNLNPARHIFSAPGVYEVVVTVENATHTASATQTVTVVAGDVYVSPTGTHVPPFASWTTAATNIQEAVDAALWGGTVWLADGDYALGGRPAAGLTQTNRVCIERMVTLRGDKGPDGVMVRGAWHEPGVTACGPGAVRGVYLGHAEARLLNLTITGGASGTVQDEDDGGGVVAVSPAALASNCVVTACLADDEGGGVFGGTWVSCELRENSSDYGGGASQAQVLKSQLSENTAVYDGGGAYESTLSDTALIGNASLQSDGGGLSGCTATRCLLRNNSAYDDGGASSDSDLVNCLLNSNAAANGGGAAYGTLELCTVVTNTASVMGGGLYYVNTVTNSIVWANGAPLDTEYTGSYFNTSLTSPLPTGEYDLGANLTGDPEFVNPAAGNYRLRGTSPCVNTGVPEGYAVEEDATDLDGRARVLGSAVDRGVYEYETAPGFAALGTPIDWLDDYFAGPDWDALELDDPDNDGFKTWEEYIALTNPTLEGSRFVIAEMVTTETGVNLSFDTAAGRVYTVLATDTLSAAFHPTGASVSGTGGRVTVPVADPGPFYRVRVALP